MSFNLDWVVGNKREWWMGSCIVGMVIGDFGFMSGVEWSGIEWFAVL